MKSQRQAEMLARQWAKKRKREYFVVLDRDLYEIPGNDYHVANAIDLDTYFAGCKVLYSTDE